MKKVFFISILIYIVFSCSSDNSNNTTDTIPTVPNNLIGQILSTTSVGLSWTDNSSNEIGFKIERKSGVGNFSLISTTTSGVVNFIDSGLSQNTTYTYRIFSFNDEGNSAYSNELVITTNNLPIITTNNISQITGTTSLGGGNIISNGGNNITSRGVVWSTNPNPTILLSTKTNDGGGNGQFNSNITGLLPNTSYYIRAYATNSNGTSYGNLVQFYTIPILATLTTTSVSTIKNISAICGGNITNNGGADVFARGVVWSTNPNPNISLGTKTVDGIGNGSFVSNITNLLPNTTYYVRAYATNASGINYSANTSYGNQLTFTTQANLLNGSGLSDIDGNQYQSVIIYGQEWMQKNLNVTKYRNGDPIPQITDDNIWATTTTGAWRYYANITANGITYGKLYNWYAVNDPRGLAPQGWHIPSKGDWNDLFINLGGTPAGGKLKETGTSHWQNPNVGATNETNFTAIPSNPSGQNYIYISATWWSNTWDAGQPGPHVFNVQNAGAGANLSPCAATNTQKLSVRCIKD
jgi:uncharacterized protein (TIGR02145 family)